MARMISPVALLALLALMSCSGCASWHPRSGPDAIYPGYVAAPDYGGSNSWIAQTLSDASVNGWNFKGMPR